MIDSHCHLECMDNASDVIERCRNAGLAAVVNVATHPKEFEKGVRLSRESKGFVFAAAGVHPEFLKELAGKDVEDALQWIRSNENSLVGIGEQGLDYKWIKEPALRERQKAFFARTIQLSNELDKMIIVHTRDAHEDALKILEKGRAGRVQLHMWGDNASVKTIADHGWYVSVGPVVATSKKHRKVVRDMPVELLMLETDSPWFGAKDASGKPIGEPTNIRVPCQQIAEIKEMDFEDAWKACGKNAVKAFRLPINLH